MRHSSQQHISNESSNKDIIDNMCDKAGRSCCKTAIRCLLGIAFEEALIDGGLLAEVTDGRFVLLEHTSKKDKFESWDGICEYDGERAYFEVKSTFLRLGTYQKGRNIDTLIMNNMQNSKLRKLLDAGERVLLFVYFYLDNVLLVIDFRSTDVVDSTSPIEDGLGKKTFYDFEDSAVQERFDDLLTHEFRAKLRTLQYEHLTTHQRYCSGDECRLKRYR